MDDRGGVDVRWCFEMGYAEGVEDRSRPPALLAADVELMGDPWIYNTIPVELRDKCRKESLRGYLEGRGVNR